ncbi:Phosphoglucan phosphatase LSF1, chloroplastic [Vitis vinifera]|uniref:Phosphoglucan phosphatase LSF1, chloroplastic n=1 Tax=Vitis vinifera TaxID=29760 RepID=A0A438JIQ3_VITVI|nr:Phosphoglucan phosphatase LSF1, chloroplastic [Vitis vinifera]
MALYPLQLSSSRAFHQSSFLGPFSASSWGRDFLCFPNATAAVTSSKKAIARVYAMSSDTSSSFKMNLNEYMVTLEKPLGIRFALSADGKVFVHALKKGGNAEKSRIIMVGDTLKKASDSPDGGLVEIKDYGDTQKMLEQKTGSFSLVLERPFSPFPIQQLHLMSDLDILFNRGRVPVATWNKTILASNLQTCSDGGGNSGFVTFSPKFITSQGWKFLMGQNGDVNSKMQRNILSPPISQLVCIFSEEESGDVEWLMGAFHWMNILRHWIVLKANYIIITLLVCVTVRCDVQLVYAFNYNDNYATSLRNFLHQGITAILNFQSGIEAENWGINSRSINESCQKFNILMINYPIREVDSYDTSLHAAYNFVTGLHSCRPDRPAIAWATWDLIAMVEKGKHDGPATHAVTFVWNGHEGEEVFLVGDFTANWKEPIKAVHKGGSRYEVEVRLTQGKYYYKFITNGQWRHSTASPTERDERANVNNVIVVGDIASVRPSIQQQKKVSRISDAHVSPLLYSTCWLIASWPCHPKDSNVVKVIERQLTENERFMLAKAARCIAFSVCPIRLAPK